MHKKLLVASALSALAVSSATRADDTENFTSVFTTPQANIDSTAGPKFITFFTMIKFGAAAPVAAYDEFSLPAAVPPSVMWDIEDNTGQDFVIPYAGYALSDTLIPLGDLDPIDYAPSLFHELPDFEDPIHSGSGISGSVILPEPASLGVLAISGILATRKRRRRVI